MAMKAMVMESVENNSKDEVKEDEYAFVLIDSDLPETK